MHNELGKTFQNHDEPASVNYTDTMKLILF